MNGNQKANNNNNNGNPNNQKEATSNFTYNNSNDYVPPRRYRFNGKCDHCGKWGHRKEYCWILKKNYVKNKKVKKRASCTQPYQTTTWKTNNQQNASCGK